MKPKKQKFKGELTNVTYLFKDGTRVVQPITEESRFDEKGRVRSIGAMINDVFNPTANDKGAYAFSLEGIEEQFVKEPKTSFTAKQRKDAKRDYNEIRKQNPEGFAKSLTKFRSDFVDSLSKRIKKEGLKFNLRENGVGLLPA